MLRPTEDEPGQPGASWSGSVQAKLSDEQWQELIAADSPLHQRWEKYIDTAAAYLKQLQDAHIAVLWRPMHENNGTFFWWGGRPGPYGTAMLYREVYNRMVNVTTSITSSGSGIKTVPHPVASSTTISRAATIA
ncbi:MAG: glycosyl hydrolase, partial [Ignavibacteriota bacterium]